MTYEDHQFDTQGICIITHEYCEGQAPQFCRPCDFTLFFKQTPLHYSSYTRGRSSTHNSRQVKTDTRYVISGHCFVKEQLY